MSTQTATKIHAIGIGIDVSKDKLDLAIRLSNQNYLESSFGNDAVGVNALCDFMKRQEATDVAPLIIESTGDYHLQSALIIKKRDYNVKVINPILTKRYQKSSIRNAKDDKIDAKRLADIAVMEQNLPDFKGDITHVQARKLTSVLAQLEKSKQQLSMSLKRFKQTAKIIGLEYETKHFEAAIEELDEQIRQTNRALADLLPDKLKTFADQTKGLTRERLAVIYAFIGDKQFENKDKLVAFFGLDIAVRKSGQWIGKAKLSKRGNSFARKVLYQIAWGLKGHNVEFAKCYHNKFKERGLHYNAVLMMLARKFLRFYFSYNFKGTAII